MALLILVQRMGPGRPRPSGSRTATAVSAPRGPGKHYSGPADGPRGGPGHPDRARPKRFRRPAGPENTILVQRMGPGAAPAIRIAHGQSGFGALRARKTLFWCSG